jgi:hypothetical protein
MLFPPVARERCLCASELSIARHIGREWCTEPVGAADLFGLDIRERLLCGREQVFKQDCHAGLHLLPPAFLLLELLVPVILCEASDIAFCERRRARTLAIHALSLACSASVGSARMSLFRSGATRV